MPKYNYWCQDCTCGKTGKERDFVIEKSDKKRNKKEYCPRNRKVLKLMGEQMIGTASRTMNKEELVKSLKKRSSQHFKKEIKEQKVDMIRKSGGR